MTSEVLGDNILQCQEISSSSDLFDRPFQSNFSFRGRPSYRRSFRLLSSNQRPRHFPSMTEPDILQNSLYAAQNHKVSPRSATLTIILIFLAALSVLFLVYSTFPNVTEEERQYIKIPWNLEDAKNLAIVLNRYKSDHYYQVLSGIFLLYIILQAFAIPGSLFLSILSGFLFPFFVALFLVCTCSMIGASLCFMLSQLFGRRIVFYYFPEKARTWAAQVEKHRDNLLNYVIFLRVTPFLPNWFINLTAPLIGVPLFPFAFGTFVGVAPPSFLAIQGGQTLHDLTASSSGLSFGQVFLLLAIGSVSLVPVLLKNKLREKID